MRRDQRYSPTLSRFRAEARKVNRLLATGEFNRLSLENRNRLIARLRRFYLELSQAVSGRTLRRVLASAGLLLGMGFASQVQAQSFAAPVTNSFNVTSVYYNATPDFVDIDGDGDLDLFVGEYGEYYGGVQYYENTGTATSPAFTSPLYNPFGITATNQDFHPRFVDIDGDGDYDLFVGERGGDMMYMENTGTATAPAFAAQIRNPFNLTSCNDQAFLSFPDLDNDGDYDLMAGEVGGTMQYFENIGTAQAPAFGPPFPNPFGLSDVFAISMPEMADIDGDGDLDLLVGENNGNLEFFLNVGTDTLAAFDPPVQNPFGIIQGDGNSSVALDDTDADGDYDLWLGEMTGTLQYQENRAIVSAQSAVEDFARVDVFPNPTSGAVTVDIRADQSVKEVRLELYDALGRMVEQRELDRLAGTFRTQLDLSELSAGAYNLRLRSGDRVLVRRIVRE